MINYPFDIQINTTDFDETLQWCDAFLETATFEKKIEVLAFLLQHHAEFEQNRLFPVLKKHYSAAYFTNLVYNTSIENYFFEGKVGVLFLVFKLEQLLPETSFSEVIDNFLKAIMFQLRFSPLLCHHDGNQQQSPVGFSKGNSGIAYGLMLLSEYFGNKDIALLSKGLLAYEDTMLSQHNYHTYQSPVQDVSTLEQFKEKHLQKNTTFFSDREEKLTPKEALKMFYIRTELIRILDEIPNISILEMLVDQIVVDKKLEAEYAWCKEVIHILASDESYKELPEKASFIKITPSATSDFTFNAFVLQQFTFTFRRTVILLNILEVSVLDAYEATYLPSKHPLSDFFKQFYEHCKSVIKTQKEHHQACLFEILDFEYETVLMQQNISNYLGLQLEDIINVSQREKLLAQEEAVFLKTELRMNPTGKLVKTSWNWVTEEIFERIFKAKVNLEAESSEFYCYKIPLGVINLEKKMNIKEIALTEYEYILLDLFEFSVTVEDVIKEFSTIFDVENQEDFQRVTSFAKEIIKTLIFKKCLIL
ncbi:hypothetical protein [uncultured Kordia sp.]|uniref:hypothetical protein n=1 Tax=uncultured Kordia sp. TaxID=507699 RepID=UPI00261C59B7|nr:hypothetical protein [uncultured Kordia sp.]